MREGRPPIIGSADDEHAAAGAAVLRTMSVEPVLVDAASLGSTRFAMSDGVLTRSGDDDRKIELVLGPPARGWGRRLAPPGWRWPVELGTRPVAVRGAWAGLITAIARGLDWLTMDRAFPRSNKLVRTQAAARLGMPSPATAVGSEVELTPARAG